MMLAYVVTFLANVVSEQVCSLQSYKNDSEFLILLFIKILRISIKFYQFCTIQKSEIEVNCYIYSRVLLVLLL